MLTSMQYVAKQGDCIFSIAKNFGFVWQTIWNDPQNANLKALRKTPNVLFPGDVVFVRDKEIRQEPRPTDARHKFVKMGVPAKLRLQLLDRSRQPRANLNYTISIDGAVETGTTDSDGRIEHSMPPDAQKAELTVQDGDNTETYSIKLGNVDPVSEDSGVQQRLKNLGYNPVAGDWSQAIRNFQTSSGLPVTGTADDATRAKLEGVHGC